MTAQARQPHIVEIFQTIEEWLSDQDQVRGRRHPAQVRHPCAPVLSMKEIANDPSLRESGTIAEVRSQGPRQVPDRRQPDQVLGHEGRDHGLAAARRAHRRGVVSSLGYSEGAAFTQLYAAKAV